MPTAEKAAQIEELAEQLRNAKGTVLLDYRGLTVADMKNLRRDLSGQAVEFHVAKNTLLRIAAERASVEIAPEMLTGPTAVAFGLEDEVAPARAMTEFARRNRVVHVKGGVLSGRTVGAEQVTRIAELPSRETLLSQLLGVMQAPMQQALGVMQAPAREVAGLAQALLDKRESGEATA